MKWYEIVVTILVSVFASTGFWNVVQSRQKKQSNETKLLMGIAYTKIVQTAENYIARGWVTSDEYHELYHYLYEPYSDMGGNGAAKRLMDIVKTLPNEPQNK